MLLEYDREKTIKQHGKALLKGLDEAPGATTGMHHPVEIHAHHQYSKGDHQGALNTLLQHFETLDPSPQKKHVRHMSTIYSNGGIERFEDMGRVANALHTHHELSKRKIIPAEHRDAGKFKTLHSLEDIVDEHKHKLSGKEESRQLSEKMNSPEHAEVNHHDEFTHIVPKTEEAAKFHGRGTRWCTAAENNNQFKYYNNDGQLHIYTPKNPKYEGEKYQAHYYDQYHGGGAEDLETAQIMDEKDVPVHDIEQRHPSIAKHMNDRLDNEWHKVETGEGIDSDESWVVNHTLANDKVNIPKDKLEKHVNSDNIGTAIRAENRLPDNDKRPYQNLKQRLEDAGDNDLDIHLEDTHAIYSGSLPNFKHAGHIKAMSEHLDKDKNDINGFGFDIAKSKHITPELTNKILQKTPSLYGTHIALELANNKSVTSNLDDIRKHIDNYHQHLKKSYAKQNSELPSYQTDTINKAYESLDNKVKNAATKKSNSSIKWHTK